MKINTSPAITAAAHDAPASNIIELNLACSVPKRRVHNRSLRRHQVNRSRAAWWFGQMRKVVNAAVEWKPTPVARPEQTYITLDARR